MDDHLKRGMNSRARLWMLVILSMLIPASGYVFLEKPVRGLMMLMWMFVFAFITLHLTAENISFIGRFSGGFAVWVLSVLEVYRLGSKKMAVNVRE